MLNRLLAALSIDSYQDVVPHLEFVSLQLGQQIYGPGQPLAVLSRLCTMKNGASAEMGIIGNDGILGTAVFMGGESVPNRAVVQIAGAAFRMRAHMLLLLRYVRRPETSGVDTFSARLGGGA